MATKDAKPPATWRKAADGSCKVKFRGRDVWATGNKYKAQVVTDFLNDATNQLDAAYGAAKAPQDGGTEGTAPTSTGK